MNSLAQQEVFESYLYMPDEDAVELAKDGDAVAEEHLINKYRNFVRAKARSLLSDLVLTARTLSKKE